MGNAELLSWQCRSENSSHRARRRQNLAGPAAAGGEISPHSHLGVVQHYVLEGEYETEGEMFGIGTYRLLPKHANVGTISTEKGAVILMIYDPVAS